MYWSSNVRPNIANKYRHEDPDVRFPVFRRTPVPLQELIKKYTAGAPEWELSQDFSRQHHTSPCPQRSKRVVRRGGSLHTEGLTDAEAQSETEHDDLETGVKWWTAELQRAKYFFEIHGDAYRHRHDSANSAGGTLGPANVEIRVAPSEGPDASY
ncbi:hypothetical protein QQS21_010357 [Conoideocrella luteorostrata]|uniref:Uncharacterized protein n=1 Tax=Conoideocrella luteorostrata TaxID=1105319 RepID=A0AAJ0CF73_9HYPO|nr:hypothetical protein QQS21_010357 [Conoideocrella luteorostrata]